MRYGFTTGSCAAAASKAAAYMLLTGKKKETISIVTPKGIVFETKLLEITRKEKSVSCAVEKDGGLTAELALAVSQDRAWISRLEMLQSIMCRAR